MKKSIMLLAIVTFLAGCNAKNPELSLVEKNEDCYKYKKYSGRRI